MIYCSWNRRPVETSYDMINYYLCRTVSKYADSQEIQNRRMEKTMKLSLLIELIETPLY